MQLLVVRHAIAEEREKWSPRDDKLRPLTDDGKKKMKEAAKGLRALVPKIDVLATSPLTRAAQTAQLLAKVYETGEPVTVEALAPGQRPPALATWLRTQAVQKTVAIVGHEPGLGAIVSWLAAARQAVLLGCRGIALSVVVGDGEPDFAGLEPFLNRVLELLLTGDAPRLVNVNFPREPEGLYWTRVSVRHYDGRVVPDKDPYGRELFWLAVRPVEEVEPDTDRWAIRHGLVSLSPLRLDLTDEEALVRMKLPRASETSVLAAAPPV